MNFRTTRTRLAAAVTAAVATGALAVSASPASATSSQGYFTGYGTTWTDDWSNEGTLSSGSYARSNATCLWQKILWAEGATESNGTAYDYADIDGIFGSNTTYASKRLQTRWGLDDDGRVGPLTLGKADNKLRYSSGSTSAGTLYLRYDGAAHDFTLRRDDNNRYGFVQDSAWRLAGYNYRTCS
ncbi:peptidoglycan-binding domain-containing protein [Streptomyces europaeiscabiei]|uniref:peptidoglycan-binding domain-containing protein n=1 Tax=Streptomyces europaeiscabiei TaxID=146819 RepID=UPI002E2A64CC|nr:peptidoglycan-binding domain-containing protein [Streptomyces europaeiscabiei]